MNDKEHLVGSDPQHCVGIKDQVRNNSEAVLKDFITELYGDRGMRSHKETSLLLTRQEGICYASSVEDGERLAESPWLDVSRFHLPIFYAPLLLLHRKLLSISHDKASF